MLSKLPTTSSPTSSTLDRHPAFVQFLEGIARFGADSPCSVLLRIALIPFKDTFGVCNLHLVPLLTPGHGTEEIHDAVVRRIYEMADRVSIPALQRAVFAVALSLDDLRKVSLVEWAPVTKALTSHDGTN